MQEHLGKQYATRGAKDKDKAGDAKGFGGEKGLRAMASGGPPPLRHAPRASTRSLPSTSLAQEPRRGKTWAAAHPQHFTCIPHHL